MLLSPSDNPMHKGRWVVPGGKFEKGESPDECIKREFSEETGLSLVNPTLKGFLTFPGQEDSDDWFIFVYVATEFTGTIKESTAGKLEWIDTDKVKELPLWDADKIFLDWIDQPQIFTAKIRYTGDTAALSEVYFH